MFATLLHCQSPNPLFIAKQYQSDSFFTITMIFKSVFNILQAFCLCKASFTSRKSCLVKSHHQESAEHVMNCHPGFNNDLYGSFKKHLHWMLGVLSHPVIGVKSHIRLGLFLTSVRLLLCLQVCWNYMFTLSIDFPNGGSNFLKFLFVIFKNCRIFLDDLPGLGINN